MKKIRKSGQKMPLAEVVVPPFLSICNKNNYLE
jgi:hypothetical protein